MGPALIDSQFAALKPPGEDETDAVVVEERGAITSVVGEVEASLAQLRAGTSTTPLWSVGDRQRVIAPEELASIICDMAERGCSRRAWNGYSSCLPT